MTAPKIVVPDQGENWCGQLQCLRHKETIDVVGCLTQFITHQDMKHQNDSVLKTSKIVKIVNGIFLRCPAQFCEFRSEILASCSNRACEQTDSLPVTFFSFRKVIVALVYFGPCIGRISRTKN